MRHPCNAYDLRDFAPGAWRIRLLSWGGSPADRAEARHSASRVRPLSLEPTVGSCWFPVVAPQADDTLEGVLVRVTVGEGPRPIDPQACARAASWVAGLIAADAPALPPVLHIENLPPDWQLEGRSLELACAMAWLSHRLQRAPRCPVIVSAALGAPGHVTTVQHTRSKHRIIDVELWSHDDAERLVADHDSESTALLTRTFGARWREDLFLVHGTSASAQATLAQRHYDRHEYPRAQQLADAAIHSTSGLPQATARWIAGATRLHQGETASALALIQEAWQTLRSDRFDEAELYLAERLSSYLGVALLDSLRPAQAVRVLEESLAQLDTTDPGYRYRRWRESVIFVAGTLRRARVLTGDLDGALSVQRDRALGDAALDKEQARCLIDLADVQLKMDRHGEARDSLAEAERALEKIHEEEERGRTLRFLRIQQVRADLHAPGADPAPPNWRDFPQPIEAMQAAIARGPEAFRRYTDALPEIEDVYALALSGEAARAAIRWGHTPWIEQIARQLIAAFSEDDGTGAALEALARGDGAAWLRRAPY